MSSNFGTVDAAQFNIEQLLNAGISNDLFSNRDITLSEKEEVLLGELAEISLVAYKKLKDHPYLADYLLQVSPLRFYNETNIGSIEGFKSSTVCRFLESIETKCNRLLWCRLCFERNGEERKIVGITKALSSIHVL